jgi:hypothetical protein
MTSASQAYDGQVLGSAVTQLDVAEKPEDAHRLLSRLLGERTVWVLPIFLLSFLASRYTPRLIGIDLSSVWLVVLGTCVIFAINGYDVGTFVWSGIGCFVGMALTTAHLVPLLLLVFPAVFVLLAGWLVWRWYHNLAMVPNSRARRGFFVLVICVLLMKLSIEAITRHYFGLTIAQAANQAFGGGHRFFIVLDAFWGYASMLRVLCVTGLLAVAALITTHDPALYEPGEIRNLSARNRSVYRWRTFRNAIQTVMDGFRRIPHLMASFLRAVVEMADLNVRLLGRMAVDGCAYGPAALALGFLVFSGVGGALGSSLGSTQIAMNPPYAVVVLLLALYSLSAISILREHGKCTQNRPDDEGENPVYDGPDFIGRCFWISTLVAPAFVTVGVWIANRFSTAPTGAEADLIWDAIIILVLYFSLALYALYLSRQDLSQFGKLAWRNHVNARTAVFAAVKEFVAGRWKR